MRGKGIMVFNGNTLDGITPAYAGKSNFKHLQTLLSQDHPCVCGEKFAYIYLFLVATGSPLRMRGKDAPAKFEALQIRITPAYAGKRAYEVLKELEA